MALWWVGIDQTDAVRLASKAPFRQQVVLGVSEPLADVSRWQWALFYVFQKFCEVFC
jgi:hypothetical protein